MRIYAIDPGETWEVDFAREVGKKRGEFRRRLLDDARKEAAAAAGTDRERVAAEAVRIAERELADADKDAASCMPASGPIFTIGHIPGAKRAEIEGIAREVAELKTGRDKRSADFAWQREVVRWAVRGHRGLARRDGSEAPFETETVQLDGEARQVPSRRTLEVYAGSGLLFDLAILAFSPQRLEESEKNG